MKKLTYVLGVVAMFSIITLSCEKNQNTITPQDQESIHKAGNDCVKIQDGILEYPAGHYLAGEQLETGYDIFGYNYQAHIFSGYFANTNLGTFGFPPYEGDAAAYVAAHPTVVNFWFWQFRDIDALMKWNDVYSSNKDCDGDGVLDSHYGYDSYFGSGAWETIHQSGTYLDEDGNECHWNTFTKIIAPPTDAYLFEGIWYNADGSEIGPAFGSFAVILGVTNDPCAGLTGAQYISPENAGLGGW